MATSWVVSRLRLAKAAKRQLQLLISVVRAALARLVRRFKQLTAGGNCSKRAMAALPCGRVLHEQCVEKMRRLGASARCPLYPETHRHLTSVQTIVDSAVDLCMRDAFQDAAPLFAEAVDVELENASANLMMGELCRSGRGVPSGCPARVLA